MWVSTGTILAVTLLSARALLLPPVPELAPGKARYPKPPWSQRA